MTTKQTTKKTAKRRPSVKDRARRIINDAEGYDVDTREARTASLESGDAEDLRETVERAEAGEIILDLSVPAAKYAEVARLAVGMLNNYELPDFMLTACMDAIRAAASHFNVEYMEDNEDDGLSVSKLAELFRLARARSYQLPEPSAPTLAEQISAVLRNPETPEQIREGILKGMTLYDEDVTDPAYVALILAAAKEKGE